MKELLETHKYQDLTGDPQLTVDCIYTVSCTNICLKHIVRFLVLSQTGSFVAMRHLLQTLGSGLATDI